MKENSQDKWYLGLSILVSLILVADLFVTSGHSAYMDGIAHLTTLTQFYESMKQGIWLVRWTDGFANYGMPIPLYIHQTVGYLGGWLAWLFLGNVVLVYKVMFAIGSVISAAAFYKFLRIYYRPLAAFAGVIIMNFAPYRIMNLYIREALPEFMAAVMFPAILWATHNLVVNRSRWSGAILTGVFAIIALSHPMMLVVGSLLFAAYFLYLVWGKDDWLKITIVYGAYMLWGILIAAYFLIPLTREIKYFYYGLEPNHLTPGQYLGLNHYFDPKWYYFYVRDVANRGHFVKGGLLETLIMVGGTASLIISRIKQKYKRLAFWEVATMVGIGLIFFTTKYSAWFYENINLLSNIQFPWRMLSAYIYIPAILIAAWIDHWRKNKQRLGVLIAVIVVVAISRFPQIYAKNNTMHDVARYYFTPVNLHSTLMNTVWTGETTTYPIKKEKGEIIEGTGELTTLDNRYGIRHYRVTAETELRLVDYTFYFPGWEVKVDGVGVPIEFQDPDYRGVITYHVPTGEHDVRLYFGDTKLRKGANLISMVSALGFAIYLLIQRQHSQTIGLGERNTLSKRTGSRERKQK